MDNVEQIEVKEEKKVEQEEDCFVSIDVECAAIGHGHFDKVPCRIAMVDYDGKTLFDIITKVPNIADPLIEFTGLTIQQINEGVPLEKALTKLHKLLSKMQCDHKNGVTIVGQAPHNDIIWVKLKKGIHYNKMIDIAQMFKTGKYYYSLRKVAFGLLLKDMRSDYHDPTEDARVSMKLYREYSCGGMKLKLAKNLLSSMGKRRAFPDFRVKIKYSMCQGMYNPKFCWCGQPTGRNIYGIDAMNKVLEETEPVVELTEDHRMKRLNAGLSQLAI